MQFTECYQFTDLFRHQVEAAEIATTPIINTTDNKNKGMSWSAVSVLHQVLHND